MKKSIYRLGLFSQICLFYLATTTAANTQIVPDTTLPSNSIITPQGNTSLIEGGTTAGRNLFHSFETFSIPTSGTAFFNNPLDIQNIFSRVTGNKISNIDGLIRANGTANLFLLNPNGIIFGPNARLNIGGSFLGTTATKINFADGSFFSTKPAEQTTPLLTISLPIGLQYGNNSGNIQVQGSTLQVNNGNTLALVGGNVSLNGGQLLSPGGRIELGSVADTGNIGLSVNSAALGLTYPQEIALLDTSIDNGTQVNVRAAGGGNISINARSLNMTGTTTQLQAGIASGLSAVDTAGDIQINVSENININGSSIFNDLEKESVGKAGQINITTASLSLTNGAEISASAYGQGEAGNITINARDTISLDGVGSDGTSGGIYSSLQEGAVGKSGEINIDTGSLIVTNGALVAADTNGLGDGGNVTINARNNISFDGVGSNGNSSGAGSIVFKTAVGKGGDVSITTGSLSFTNGGALDVSTFGQGDGGNVTIIARDTISVDGMGTQFSSGIYNRVEKGAVGKGGSINITTGSLSLTNGGILTTNTLGQGNGGTLTINARDTIFLDGATSNGLPSAIFSRVESGAVGKGGSVNVTTGSLKATNGAGLGASTLGQGNAGNVTINARDTISFDGVGSSGIPSAASSRVEKGAVGNGGNVNITTGSLSLSNGAELSASTFGQGNAGNVTINARDTISLSGDSRALSFVELGAVGNGGSISITTGSLFQSNGGLVAASTFGEGNGGNVTIIARDTMSLDGVSKIGIPSAAGSRVEKTGVGNGGNVNITTGSLSLSNGAELSASTLGKGNAGNLSITVNDRMSLSGDSKALSFVELGAVGNGGSINITTGSLFQSNGSLVAASTFGQGNGGNVTIIASDTISLDGVGNLGIPSASGSRVEKRGVGNGGNVNITTGSLFLSNGAEISASTLGQGNAGNVTINARDGIFLDGASSTGSPSAIFSRVEKGAIGDGGNINITTGSLIVTNGAGLGANTFSQGKAGSLTINARDTISFDAGNNKLTTAAGSRVEVGAEGNAGDIYITTESLSLSNGAALTVSSQGKGAAGNIEVKANSIRLDNNAQITANTIEGEGNIRLDSQSLEMRRGSSITTNATGSTITGGNITLNANTIAALENSDITANSQESLGGKVIISSQGIFGTQFRLFATPESDITASGGNPALSGTVNINTPNINPSSGLVRLSVGVIDTENQIAASCAVRNGNEFTVTGRGGLPTNPKDSLFSAAIWFDLRDVDHTLQTISSRKDSLPNNRSSVPTTQLVEAQGWIINAKGEVVLTANSTTVTPHAPALTEPNC